jgi:hypothetical protein
MEESNGADRTCAAARAWPSQETVNVNETPSGRGDDPPSARRQRIAAVGQKARGAPRPNLVERRMSKFLREPPSIRMAASVIVTATALVVVGGGVLIRVLDHSEYPNI